MARFLNRMGPDYLAHFADQFAKLAQTLQDLNEGIRAQILTPALTTRSDQTGAHVASPMVGGRLKGSPCLQRADEGHTVVDALGRTSYTPNPRSPEGFRNPAQLAPESPCPGRGSRCVRPGGANRAGLLFVVVLWLNLLLLLK